MKKAIIDIRDMKRNFQMGNETVHALKGINLTIREGEFVTIMGPSGSGKSTLLNILGCLDRPSSGDYILDGISVKNMSKNDLAHIRNTKIGFIFQSYNLLARTSAIENVELPLMYNPKVSAKERRERAIEALISVGLESRLILLPSELSGGQQQRVAIARSLVNNPVILLADEATGNLDTKTSYEVMELFQRLNDQGSTIGFVTHEDDIAQFSKRTVVLKDGHIISDKEVTDRLNAKEQLAQLRNTNDE
ncbi:ABC transporter, ATP-binding protein [Capnocytophaga sp. oral taxon 332 str. F0381]|uniref:ABC transporter ATP-binding protein n=1 Tax=Capnocytophaga sp. oral taxon 332 TaxID=712213 RepID=UPI0002A1D171|nr:ABC transporter ATP-binding protein [Capnocytophaga sp. oral taxon 332]EKY12329.1 ABC transporter, ATP-binding protein [Capnocytophaga sp. oral taxon 332 str. F0381]